MSTKYRTLFWPLETKTDRSSVLVELPVLAERHRHEGSIQENGLEYVQTVIGETKAGRQSRQSWGCGDGELGKVCLRGDSCPPEPSGCPHLHSLVPESQR